MTQDSDIEEVNQAIDKMFLRPESRDEIDKRKPKPFRYLTNPEEIRSVLNDLNDIPMTVMKDPSTPKIIDENFATLSLGDVDAIESVIRRHEVSRKFKDIK